jgi:O-antigen ligase/tetratricopeptide (TPR) repeat protein
MGKQSRDKWQKGNEADGGEVRVSVSRSGFEKTCLFIITWGTYLALFTPLILNTKFFFPFVAPKTIFFRIIVEIITAAYLLLVFTQKRYRPRISPLNIALTVFLAVFILASFMGINLDRSFWSTNERMTGIWTMLHLFSFFMVLTSVFKKRKDWEKILGVSVIVGTILGLYILMGNQISTRGGGTIGNTSFMAAYLLFDIFFAIILLLARSAGWWVFSGASLVIMLPILFTSTARGAIISFFGGLFLLGLGHLAFSQRKSLKRLALAIILVLIVLGAAAAVFQPSFIKSEAVNTLGEMKSRFVVWEAGWKGFLERPVLGWGPENFIVVFGKHFNPCMFLSKCGGEIWFDRVHNVVLDTLVTTGVVGLLSYLAIFGVAVYGLLRLLSRITERKNIIFPLGLIVLLLTYFFQNLLVFDMINSYLMFFLTLAFIGFLTQDNSVAEDSAAPKKLNPVFSFSVILITITALWAGNIGPLAANHYIIKLIATANATEVTTFFQKSLGSWMNEYEAREQFTQKVMGSDYQSVAEKDKVEFQKIFNLAESEMEESVAENKLDFRPRLFLGQLYEHAYRFSGQPADIALSESTLESAMQLSPTNQQGYWNLADAAVVQGKKQEAVDLLKEAVGLEPELGRSHWYLSTAYRIAGDYQSALNEIKLADENGYSWLDNPSDMQIVVNLLGSLDLDVYQYFSDKDTQIVSGFLDWTQKEPDNYRAWMYLATGYANLGQYDKARGAAVKVSALNPAMADKINQFLELLPE